MILSSMIQLPLALVTLYSGSESIIHDEPAVALSRGSSGLGFGPRVWCSLGPGCRFPSNLFARCGSGKPNSRPFPQGCPTDPGRILLRLPWRWDEQREG